MLCGCGCGTEVPPDDRGRERRYVYGHRSRVDRKADYVETPGPMETPCWVWNKVKTPKGYGQTFKEGTTIRLYAHRVFYERAKGPIPKGMQIDHLCRNTSCVNPEHLEVVTAAVNIQRGSRAKLSPEACAEIRASTATDRELAKVYGVAHSTIGNVRRATSWAEGAQPVARRRGKLNPEMVRRIRASKLPSRDLAAALGVSHTAINDVRSGRRWGNVR